eukprot:GHRR01033675.1.p1 GENE.GHRR01033675.1~~GHRR01033675.1.p1  ORF type:complete len:146 (-),score=41.30 GHRR01033675.1:338-775(-)
MLTGHSLKAAILKTYKEGGRRVATDGNSNTTADRYLLQYGLHGATDPTRAIGQLHAMLLEGNLSKIWQQTKQRLKTQLREAYTSYKPKSAAQSTSKVPSAELQHLYGCDGIFRVRLLLCQQLLVCQLFCYANNCLSAVFVLACAS